ncbi:TPA: hypothetical protein KDY48_004731 [Vibrio parahaemolyticus]|nr:hypothetical protein [Vibrio parahaemolyticus]HAV1426676.1 hypothetical protein [Vibrio parahaemolyticus]HAV1998369.1 hypothetical protein [Vibrio parahaemolyticus]HBC3383448.1 hypothetical protein [Vibrio parahaemolyticus]HBC3445988.1 hypothetical protein [Vibrio parahaemolyticus]
MLEINNTAFFSGAFSDTKRQFNEACTWLEKEMGFPYKRTRMGEYEEYLKLFVNPGAQPPKDDEELVDKFYTFMQASNEACQIVRLWNTFKEGQHDGLKERIKKVMSGKSIRAEAIKQNQNGQADDPARDFAYELNVASRFLKGGFAVDLTDECDVVVNIDGQTLFIECKRIKSQSQLNKRVSKAAKQIDKRIGSVRKGKYGLVALDVTDVLLPDGTVTATTDARLFNLQIQNAITNYAKEHSEVVTKSISRNVAGVLFEFNSTAFISAENKEPTLCFGRSACISRLGIKGKKSFSFVEQFREKIANQNI